MTVFIQADNGRGDIFEMDATEEVAYILSGRPTQYAIEGRPSSSDHYTQTPDTWTLTGSVHNVKLRIREGVTTSVEDFEKGLQSLKRSGQFFSLSFSDNLDVALNCLFTNLRMSRTAEVGDGLVLSMSIQQVPVADQSEVVLFPIPAERFKDQATVNQAGTGNTVTPNERKADTFEQGLRLRYGDPTITSDLLLPPSP